MLSEETVKGQTVPEPVSMEHLLSSAAVLPHGTYLGYVEGHVHLLWTHRDNVMDTNLETTPRRENRGGEGGGRSS